MSSFTPFKSFANYSAEAAAKAKIKPPPVSMNTYLLRAKKSLDNKVAVPASGLESLISYGDRLLGGTARKERTRAELLSRMAANPANKNNKYIQRMSSVIGNRAKQLTQETRTSRIRTGVALGGLGLVHSSMKQLSQPPQVNAGYNYNYADNHSQYL